MSPHEQGRVDARNGVTACPYGDPYDARRWEIGYDKERRETPGPERFSARRRSRQ